MSKARVRPSWRMELGWSLKKKKDGVWIRFGWLRMSLVKKKNSEWIGSALVPTTASRE